MSENNDHAIVIGASMAGLLAARVLSETYSRVTVLDRDLWKSGAVSRRGVPQGSHAHGLLSSGLRTLEDLFPGINDEMRAAGATFGDVQRDFAWRLGGGRLAAADSGLVGIVGSRPMIESVLRARVLAIGNVTVHQGRSVAGLTRLGDRITGVELYAMDGAPTPMTTLTADLVVDASGRTSKTPAWLERMGYGPVAADKVRVDIGYTTRLFERRSGDIGGLLGSAQGATPESLWGGAMLAIEGDRWMVTIAGYHGRRAPMDLDGFRCTAARVNPFFGEVATTGRPLGHGARFGFPASVRHRYDRVRHLPDGLLVIGDALCSFNPVYGQGISVAAAEANVLRTILAEGTSELSGRYLRAVRPIVDIPWRLAAGADLSLAQDDQKQPLAGRLVGRYLRAYLVAARQDPELAGGFLRVSNLLEAPTSLFTPSRIRRVRAGVRQVEQAAAPDAIAAYAEAAVGGTS